MTTATLVPTRPLAKAESAIYDLLATTTLTYAEIGARRGTSEGIIKVQAMRIFRKIGVRSRVELVQQHMRSARPETPQGAHTHSQIDNVPAFVIFNRLKEHNI